MHRTLDTSVTDVTVKVRTWKSADTLALAFRNADFNGIADTIVTANVREVHIREVRHIRLTSDECLSRRQRDIIDESRMAPDSRD